MEFHEIRDVRILELMHMRNARPGLCHVRRDLAPQGRERLTPFVAVHGGKDVGAMVPEGRAAAPCPFPHECFHVVGRDPASRLRAFHVCEVDSQLARKPSDGGGGRDVRTR